MKAIQVEKLRKSYGTNEVLRGLDLAVEQGEVFALLGVNGAGKTTALECIQGLRSYEKGQVSVNGRMGVQLQSASLPFSIRAMEALSLFARWNGTRVEPGLLETLDIHELGKQLYGKLSPGQKRRLHLALALVGDPDILFLDEPTAGLDVQGRMALRNLLAQLKRQGKTVVLTSHDMGEVENLCDTLAILAKGKVVFAGTPQQLRQQEGRANKVILHTEGETICFSAEDLGRDLLSQLELCRAAGQKVLDIQVERDSLEQCFLRLTEEENR